MNSDFNKLPYLSILNENNSIIPINHYYHLAKFEINSESIKLVYLTFDDIKNDIKNFSKQLLFSLSNTNSPSPKVSRIICEKINSVAIWDNHSIILRDNDGNSLIFSQFDTWQNLTKEFEDNWAKLVRAIEIYIFPHLVNYIVEEILSNGYFEINKSYNLHVLKDGVKIMGKFINIENIVCKINFKKWEVKISNKKNIFQRTTIGTSNPNIIILPYLIDYLKIIHNQ